MSTDLVHTARHTTRVKIILNAVLVIITRKAVVYVNTSPMMLFLLKIYQIKVGDWGEVVTR
jgi:hypothetical protein